MLQKIENAKKRKEKEAVLARLLQEAMKCSTEDVISVMQAFTSDLPLDQFKYYARGHNYNDRHLTQAIANALSGTKAMRKVKAKKTKQDDVVKKYEKLGNMGETAAYFKSQNPVQPLFKEKGMSITECMDALRASAGMPKGGNETKRCDILSNVLQRCQYASGWKFVIKIFGGTCESMGFTTKQILKCLAKAFIAEKEIAEKDAKLVFDNIDMLHRQRSSFEHVIKSLAKDGIMSYQN